MPNTQSLVYLCADADKVAVNLAMAAFYGNPSNAQNVSVALVPLTAANDGSVPATYWGGANWVDAATSTALKDWPDGALPTPQSDWSNYGLDDTSALAAGAKMIVQAMTAADGDDSLPETNFNALLTARGLQRIVYAP